MTNPATTAPTAPSSSRRRSILARIPGFTAVGALLSTLLRATLSPRVLALWWGVVAIPSLFLVWPMFRTWNERLAQHPGATPAAIDQSLDVDLLRRFPDVFDLDLAAAALFVFVASAVLGGGLLAALARPERFRTHTVLVEGVRHLPRNIRVLALGLFAAILVGWGATALDGWLRAGPLREVDPGAAVASLGPVVLRWYAVLDLISLVETFAFLAVLFCTKVAMARLVLRGRRSTIGAMTRSAVGIVRRPITTFVFVAGPFLVGGLGVFALGELQVQFVEVGIAQGADSAQRLLIGLALGQLAVLWWLATTVVGGFLLARRFAILDGAADSTPLLRDGSPGERVVSIPRGAASAEASGTVARTPERARSPADSGTPR